MVRGVIKNGMIQPLTPLPPEWREGQAVVIETSDAAESPADIEQWVIDMRDPASGLSHEESQVMIRAIEEHLSQQKELMKKRSGLP